MLDLGWRNMQSRFWIAVGAVVFAATMAIAQDETTITPVTLDGESAKSATQESFDRDLKSSLPSKSDEEIAREISAYESIDAQIFGDSKGKNNLPVDI
jgi:hypothetical protein